MTIHSSHPFPAAEDPLRRLRGRLGGAVALVTAGAHEDAGPGVGACVGPRAAGLTVTSLMVAGGEPGRMLALVDPDSELCAVAERERRAVVQLMSWRHRDLADAFAGLSPAPGGAFRMAEFTTTPSGPRLADACVWASLTLESAVEVGWSRLLTWVIDQVHVGADDDPLLHRRGRYQHGGAP